MKLRYTVERLVTMQFIEVFRAYIEASSEVQAVIRDMCEIYKSPDADEDEKDAAIITLIEALFPSYY